MSSTESHGQMHPEVLNFERDPVSWMQAWTDNNGKVEVERTNLDSLNRYSVRLYVEGDNRTPISTGCHESVAKAFRNAISGLTELEKLAR